MKTTGNSDFDKGLKRLRTRLAQLARTTAEDPSGRRRGRRGALSALSLLRAAMDRQFPAIIVKRKFVRLKTFEGRAARLKKAGWTMVSSDVIPGYATAGVTAKRLEHVEKGRGTHVGWFIPTWAVAIAGTEPVRFQKELRAAKKSVTEKRAALASHVMAEGT